MSQLTAKDLRTIVKKGKLYNPATTHHEGKLKTVFCDNCRKSRLDSSFGYKHLDLCLNCYENAKELKDAASCEDDNQDALPINQKLTRMAQGMFSRGRTTRMAQDKFNSRRSSVPKQDQPVSPTKSTNYLKYFLVAIILLLIYYYFG
jgi:hypothetical protein